MKTNETSSCEIKIQDRLNVAKELSVKQRQYLKGLAHSLDPVVMIGDKGLTNRVISEISNSLKAHELIKIRIFGDDRQARADLIEQICNATDALLVQHIGKLLVLYKANSDKKSGIVLPSQ